MAGRPHAARYRAPSSMFDTDLADIRLVAIAGHSSAVVCAGVWVIQGDSRLIWKLYLVAA